MALRGSLAGLRAWVIGHSAPPQALLVIGELDDERHLEGALKPLGEHEGDEVTQVQRLRRRPLCGVKVDEGLESRDGGRV